MQEKMVAQYSSHSSYSINIILPLPSLGSLSQWAHFILCSPSSQFCLTPLPTFAHSANSLTVLSITKTPSSFVSMTPTYKWVSELGLCFKKKKSPCLCIVVEHSQSRPKITHHIAYIYNDKENWAQNCFNSKHNKNFNKVLFFLKAVYDQKQVKSN